MGCYDTQADNLKDSLWANSTPPAGNTGKLGPDELKCTTSDLAKLMTRCFVHKVYARSISYAEY
eukprot:1156657-Pelagomonas_calceolata.AAC.2